MGYCTISAKGKRHTGTYREFEETGEIGDWWIDEKRASIYIMIPTNPPHPEMPPKANPTRWPYRDPLPNGAVWQFNGDLDKPTLTPSLHWVNMWHGWLRAGELISC